MHDGDELVAPRVLAETWQVEAKHIEQLTARFIKASLDPVLPTTTSTDTSATLEAQGSERGLQAVPAIGPTAAETDAHPLQVDMRELFESRDDIVTETAHFGRKV
jgi:hypothetical protein